MGISGGDALHSDRIAAATPEYQGERRHQVRQGKHPTAVLSATEVRTPFNVRFRFKPTTLTGLLPNSTPEGLTIEACHGNARDNA